MNFKKTMIALAALLAATTAHAGWWKTYGGEGWEEGRCVQITSDGNYITCGTKDDSLWLLKVDTFGNVIWGQIYGEHIKGKWIEETTDGGYIVAAGFTSLVKTDLHGEIQWTRDYGIFCSCVQQTDDGGYILIENEGDKYILLIKTDSHGDTLWTCRFGDETNNFYMGDFIQVTSGNGYVITGLHQRQDGEWWSIGLLLMKTDSFGNLLWTHTYGGDEFEEWNRGYCVRETSDGGYIVTGHRLNALCLLKTDSQGDTLWCKTYSAPSAGMGYSVQETTDNGYIVVGINDVFLSSSQFEITGGVDLWLLKTDSQGDTLWTRMYGGEDGDVGLCVQQTDDSGYIVSGYTLSYGAGSWDVYLLKTDSIGLLSIAEEPIKEKLKNWEVLSSLGSQIVLRYSNIPPGFNASIFDATGRKVDEIHMTESSGILTWGEGYGTGVYFIQVREKNYVQTKKLLLIH